MHKYQFYFNLREKKKGYQIVCKVYTFSYQQNKYSVYQLGKTFTTNDKKSTDNNENPSFVCYRPFMVVLFFTFKKYVNNLNIYTTVYPDLHFVAANMKILVELNENIQVK